MTQIKADAGGSVLQSVRVMRRQGGGWRRRRHHGCRSRYSKQRRRAFCFGRSKSFINAKGAVMLERIAAEEVKRIAALAVAARDARNSILAKVPDEDLGQPTPARGEHNPALGLGMEPLPPDHPARVALKEAIENLPPDARRELLALMRIGRDDYGVADWDRALADATTAFEVTADVLMDEADLAAFLLKGLYEMKLV